MYIHKVFVLRYSPPLHWYVKRDPFLDTFAQHFCLGTKKVRGKLAMTALYLGFLDERGLV